MRPPIVRIANGTFYRHHPNSQTSHPNPPLFSGLSFELPSSSASPHHWCVVGPSLAGKTTFLQLLRGQHICLPPAARSYPFLASDAVPRRLRKASRAVRYVGFDADGPGGSGLGPATSAYLSARYESRRENTDFSLRDFLLGNTQLNPFRGGEPDEAVLPGLLERVVADLRLEQLLDLPVAFLSNGQGRRARIARALLTSPEVLLLDEPFMGLDPPTVASLSPLLRGMAERASPRLLLSARPQDPLPDWITHLVYLRTDCQVGAMGPRDTVMEGLRTYARGVRKLGLTEDEKMPAHALGEMGRVLTERGIEGEGFEESEQVQVPSQDGGFSRRQDLGEAVVEMDGCQVKYGDKIALGNWTAKVEGKLVDGLVWTVRRGERWGVFGPNGSGKTTIVSLLCSDHPQTYSLPIRLFGRGRLPELASGQLPLTFWDIQARIGHSSPEVHQHMPRSLTIRQIVENAWADTFRSKPKLPGDAPAKVDACLRWFENELDPAPSKPTAGAGPRSGGDLAWADSYLFGELSFSAQRVLLFLRAVVKNPDVVVLDEAFSGMDESVRDKCALFLTSGEEERHADDGQLRTPAGRGEAAAVEGEASKGRAIRVRGLSERQALICISHVREEVPDCVREWLCLPEANSGEAARFGRLDGPLRTDRARWRDIWGVGQAA